MSEKNKDFSENSELNDNDNAEKKDESLSLNEESNTEESAETLYFADDVAEGASEQSDRSAKTEKKKKHISIKAFVLSLISTIVVAVMLTYAICSSVYQSMYAKAYADANSIAAQQASTTGITELDIIAQIIRDNHYSELDSDALMKAAIEAYIEQTGDLYAAYYTEEELIAKQKEDTGNTVGIGVSIINDKITYRGEEIAVLKVTNVTPSSPAEASGVKVGDYIYAAILSGETKTVNELGYDDALEKLLGEVDTTASFIVLRDTGKDELEQLTFNIVRKNIITQSVYYRIPEIEENAEKKVGVVRITTFDYTTPTQFSNAVDSLKEQGVEKFIFDLRYNLGGYQNSVGAILSYFLNDGDVYIRTRDKAGNIESDTVKVVSDFSGDYAGCNVSKEDIGKYKGLDVVVLCNEYTASAGELFVATFKDYGIGKIVGVKTYGKGTLQTTYYLQNYALFTYGIEAAEKVGGAIKITTHEYFSAKSDSYNGKGIEPDITVELSNEAIDYNVNDYLNFDKVDDQLKKAINILNN